MIPAANPGVCLFNDVPCPAAATIAVTGAGRSGTTMVARLLLALGLPRMGDVANTVLESPAINEAARSDDLAAFARICREMDARHPKWAFKSPKLRNHLDTFAGAMRAPRLIVVMRDPVAIAVRRETVTGVEVRAALKAAAQENLRLATRLETIEVPALVLSYEKALQGPQRIVRHIAGFAGVAVDDAAVADLAALIENGDPAYFGAGTRRGPTAA